MTTTTYDANGNMTSDGVNGYTWDRSNRLLSHGGLSYAYDGMGNRVSQDNGTDVTNYLLDIQPSLAKVIGANQERYSHDMHGVHATRTNANERYWSLPDGLGSIRAETSIEGEIVGTQNFDPYGNPMSTLTSPFGFTGEQTDPTGQIYLRARYYNPSMGTFTALDAWEGTHDRPMSLNGYSWVEGNTPNLTDASGRCVDNIVLGNLSGRFLLGNRSASLARLIGSNSGNSSTSGTTLYQILTPTPDTLTTEQIALNSAVAIYTFKDGSPDVSGSSCERGLYPASLSLGTITSDGVYTHDHYSLPEVEDINAPELNIRSNFARNPQEAQANLSQFGCVEFRGQSGTKAISGNSLEFGNTVDGVLLMVGNYSTIGSDAPVSLSPPQEGDEVFFVHVKGTPALAISDKPLSAIARDGSIASSIQGINHENLAVGKAKIDWGFEYKDIPPVGLKPAFATGELTEEPTAVGDSGSGWFNSRGELIGVTLGRARANRLLHFFDAEYFSPIVHP